MRVLDLFSGIGGFSLGLERAGMQTVAFCEIDPFCRKVLAKHWPKAPIYDDIRTLTQAQLATDGITVDLICGGFPCQDISVAGKGAGITGERSGLWREYARLIGEVRPRYVIVENVAALRSRGLGRVLGDLAALGYNAEWHCIPAFAVGAPHRRDRLWIVGFPNGDGRPPWQSAGTGMGHGRPAVAAGDDAGAVAGQRSVGPGDTPVSDTARELPHGSGASAQQARREQLTNCGWWQFEPDVGRVAHGVPARVDRLRALGNAVVPQIPEMIGRVLMEMGR